jgi:hypothetical protein
MDVLFRLFWGICIFKKGPEEVPASLPLFLTLFTANLVLELSLGLSVYPFLQSLLLSLTSFLTLLVLSYLWLFLYKHRSRLLQTMTAFAGISLLTNLLIFLPLTLSWRSGLIIDSSFALINLVSLIWILSIYAHIFRRALPVSFFLGFALALTYFVSFSALSEFVVAGAK